MKRNFVKYGKRVLSFALSIALATGMIPVAGLKTVAAAKEEMKIDNGYIQVLVSEDNGGFVIRTVEGDKINKSDNHKDLLYHDGTDDTSFTSFQVTQNGETKEYIFGENYADSSEVTVEKVNAQEIAATWSVGDLTFIETFSLVNSGANEHGTVNISYQVKNAGESVDVKCRILMDTALGSQDYAHYNVGDGNNLVASEQVLMEDEYNKSFYAVNDPMAPTIVAYTLNASIENAECKPYKTVFAHWNNLATTVFEYEPDVNMTFTNKNNKEYLTTDSAYALYFDMGNVGKNQTSVVATNYGVFSNESVSYEATAAVNVIAPDVMELTEDKSSYKDEGYFTTTTAIENVGNITYEKVRVLVYTTGGIEALDENKQSVGATYEEPYYMEFANFVPGQRQTIEWNFKADVLEEGSYSKIHFKVYNVSNDATLNTGSILAENLMGEGKSYILCPGSVTGIPEIKFTSASPDILYNMGTRNLNITGDNFSMLENTGEYKMLLSRVDGLEFNGQKSVEIPTSNIQIDGAKNTITVVMNDDVPGKIPEGQYELTFDYTDSTKDDLTAQALRFQVKEDPQYRNESYGMLAVEKYMNAGKYNYRVVTYGSEESYDRSVKAGRIDRQNVLLEFRGIFNRNTENEKDGCKVYNGISISKDDNIMTLNNCLDIKEGTITITEKNGSVTVDFDATITTTGAGTSVHSGICALTELEAGKNYGLIPYEENGDRASFNQETITLLWPSVGQAAQNLMGLLFDFKYGELGAIYHDDADETRVVAFGAAMDLSFIVPKASQHNGTSKDQLGDAYNAAMHGPGFSAEEIRAINKQISYKSNTVNTDVENGTNGGGIGSETATDTGDSASGADGDTRAASIQIDDVLFGGKYLGVNMSIALGLPGYVDGMPGVEGVLTVKTVGDWEIGLSGVCDFEICYFEAEVYIKSYENMPVPDKLRFFFAGPPPGINLDGFGVLWLQGAGGGIDNIYDTIFMTDAIPPLKLIIEAQVSLMQIISARASLELSLRGFSLGLSDGKIANAIPVLNSANLSFDWYPEFYFMSSVNISIYDAIVGSGYIVVEDNGFFEFFVRAALQIPGSIPIVGGITIAAAGLGANNQKMWGQVEVIGVSVGVVYYWGGDIKWSGGSEVSPTYPELVDLGTDSNIALMSKDDIPIYYDEETGKTLYAHVGTNLTGCIQTVDGVTGVTALENGLATNIDGKTHTFDLGANGKDKLLVLEWDADSLEKAQTSANLMIVKDNNGNGYPITFLESGKDASLQQDANANLTYNEATKKASLAISFTDNEDFGKRFQIQTADVSTAVLYDIEELPELSESTTGVSVNSLTGEVTVTLEGQNLEEYNSISFVAAKKSDEASAMSLVSGGANGVIAGSRLAQNSTVLSNVETGGDSEDTQLVYKAESATGFTDGQKITFTLPESFTTGTYELQMIATDNANSYYSEISKSFQYTNLNQPTEPIIKEVSNAGDYKVNVAVEESDATFDGYMFTAYDMEGNEISGVSNLLYYRDGSSVKYAEDGSIIPFAGETDSSEFVIGGHYEYTSPDDATKTVIAGFSAGEYNIGVKRWKAVNGGNALLSSKESFETVTVKEPVKTDITVSTDKEGKDITEVNNGVTFERTVFTENELTVTLNSDYEITGTWELDNGIKEGTAGTVDASTKSVELAFTDLAEGVHTLEFMGTNEFGDSVAKTYVFGVDTQGPRMLLSEPVSGAFFDHLTGKIKIAGLTDQDAHLTVVNMTTGENIVTNLEMDIDEDGFFQTEVTLDKSKDSHKLALKMTDTYGNETVKEIQVVSDAMGSIETLLLYADNIDVTNQKIASDNEYELSLRAVLKDGNIVVLNDPTMIEWSQNVVEGEATVKEENGKVLLNVAEDTEGIVTARFLINDNGAYPVSAAFGRTAQQTVSLDSEDTIIKVADSMYTGKAVTPEVQVWYEGTKLIRDTDYTVTYSENIEVSEDDAQVIVTGIGKYKDSKAECFAIQYLEPEDVNGNLIYKISGVAGKNDYYTSDVTISAKDGYELVKKTETGYQSAESAVIDSDGENTEYFYVRRLSDQALTDKITVTILVDRTMPTGSIAMDTKEWIDICDTSIFAAYAVKQNVATITADDAASGIAEIQYIIAEEVYTTVSAIEEAQFAWKTYMPDAKPVLETNKKQVVYAKIIDIAGNIKYISSEGILIDDIAPEVTEVSILDDETLKDTQADIRFNVNEIGTYYYALVKADAEAPEYDALKNQNIAGAIVGRGNITEETVGEPITLTVVGLEPGTAYKLYVAAEDNTIDLSTHEAVGNESLVVSGSVVMTKQSKPVVTELPKLVGGYGTKVKDMELIPGTVQVGNVTITGTYKVTSEEIPATDCETAYEVIFVPDNSQYASVTVEVVPSVNARLLTSDGVSVSEVSGQFVYNGLEHRPEVTVSDSKAEITAEDYEITFENNVNAGVAKVIIGGKGNYTGILERTFTIEKKSTSLTIESGKSNYQVKEGADSFKLEGILTDSDGKVKFETSDTEVVSVDSEGVVTINGVGTAEIRVSVVESDNCTASEIKIVTIVVEAEETTTEEETTTKEEATTEEETTTEQKDIEDNSETGDKNHPVRYIWLLIFAGGVVVVLISVRRNKKLIR